MSEYESFDEAVQAAHDKVDALQVRVVTDDEGDKYVHLMDVGLVVNALLNYQAMAKEVLPPPIAHVIMGAQVSLAENLRAVLLNPDKQIDPPKWEVPDTLPDELLAEIEKPEEGQ